MNTLLITTSQLPHSTLHLHLPISTTLHALCPPYINPHPLQCPGSSSPWAALRLALWLLGQWSEAGGGRLSRDCLGPSLQAKTQGFCINASRKTSSAWGPAPPTPRPFHYVSKLFSTTSACQFTHWSIPKPWSTMSGISPLRKGDRGRVPVWKTNSSQV